MTVLSQSAQAGANGAATVTVAVNKSGIQWVVAQMSVEARPASPNGVCTVRMNGNYYTSTATLPATAGGQPALTLQAQDALTFEFSALTPGTTGVVTIWYVETPWGEVPSALVV